MEHVAVCCIRVELHTLDSAAQCRYNIGNNTYTPKGMIQMAAHVTEAEGKILKVLWVRSPMTITQITAALRDVTGWDKHAVISLLKRMLEKGSVRMEDVKPAKLYYPLLTRDEARREQTNTILGRFFDGKPVRMVSAMVQDGQLSRNDIDELMQMLARAQADMRDDERGH